MKGKGEPSGWITRNGVHVPIFGAYTVRGGVEPKAKSAKVRSGKKKEPEKKKGHDTSLNDIRDRLNRGEITAEQAKDEAFEYEKKNIRHNKELDDREKNRLESKVRDIFDKANNKEDTSEGTSLTDKQSDRLWDMANEYSGSKPVSGNWNTETSHLQNRIAKEFGISKEQAKQVMKDELGYDDSQFESTSGKSKTDNWKEKTYTKEELAGQEGNKSKKSTPSYDRDKVLDIADRYNTSKPVSGNWDTETAHQQRAISKELGVSMDQAKQIMKDELGFSDDDKWATESTTKTNKTDAYNDKVFADFKANGKDYQRVPMEGYAGTANDFRAAAKRAGVDIEYDKGDDTFYLRKSKTESNAGSRYKTSSSDIPETTKKIGDTISGNKKTIEWKINKAYDKTSLKELALDIGIPSSKLAGMSTQDLRAMLLAIYSKRG